MSESDQELEEADQLFTCPYDTTHSLTIARMGRHLIECREKHSISEKAICPFNDKHAIAAPEMEYHKLVCHDKPPENEMNHKGSNKCDEDGENPAKGLFGSFSSRTSFSLTSCETTTTGCESGLDLVGGIRNCDSSTEETDEDTMISDSELAPNDDKQQARDGLKDGCCDDMRENDLVLPIEELKSPNHNISIEKQLEQSESDTASSGTNSSIGTDEEERFDYTKYIPSKDLREDFLKLIGQPRNGMQVQDARYQLVSQPYNVQQWPPGYSFVPAQYQTHNGYHGPGVQPAFIPFANSYNMIPGVYTGSYSFHNQSPAPGGFIQSPGQGYDFNVYPAARPNYHRPCYRRRNHYNTYSSRFNNHKHYNSHNHENHNGTVMNGYNQSENGFCESSDCFLNKMNGVANHNDTSQTQTSCLTNGCENPDQHMQNGGKLDEIDCQQQFVDIGDVPDKPLCGSAKENGQENFCSTAQEALKKSENDKQIRKIRKKLTEITGLEEKQRQGVNLDCDQLKKLSRKSEYEGQLRSLSST